MIPPADGHSEALFRDVESSRELTTGDTLIVDELLVRVRLAVAVPADDGYDATLVCTPPDD